MPLLEARDLTRHYTTGGVTVRALDGVSLTIDEGEVVALVGASGSGKSTLLNLLGGLDRPTSGELLFRGRNLAKLESKELAAYRRRDVGMVFQSFNLIAHRSGLDNVILPMLLEGTAKSTRQERAKSLLESVGLGKRSSHRPAELSGGE